MTSFLVQTPPPGQMIAKLPSVETSKEGREKRESEEWVGGQGPEQGKRGFDWSSQEDAGSWSPAMLGGSTLVPDPGRSMLSLKFLFLGVGRSHNPYLTALVTVYTLFIPAQLQLANQLLSMIVQAPFALKGEDKEL
ncbi:hypothetical protein WISP_138968 [Willisornis vidua]|uniref:Uncharacterized protein n=1 Tax=Willisornis vidua TaxID=1566151 RepID=A0ABQ9CQF3_9PASS|nr:hypothetical protein WISP_138968 [Willisornis vidua]